MKRPYLERRSSRTLIAIVFLCVASGAAMWSFARSESYRKTSVESRPLNDATMQAVELTVAESTTLYQITVAFLAALWALVVSDASRRVRFNDPEGLMVVACTVMLGAALYCHYVYVSSISDAYRTAGATALPSEGRPTMPDVFNVQYRYLLSLQRIFAFAGTVMSLWTLFSATRLSNTKG